MTNIAEQSLKKIVDIVFPPRCFGCNNFVSQQDGLCADCWNKIHFIDTPYCNACGHPFEYDQGANMLCGSCTQKHPPYYQGRAVLNYNEHSRKLITRFKYGDKIHASDMFGRWLVRSSNELLARSDFLIPVPLHKIRLFTRRYNQAALLAHSMHKYCRTTVLADALIRKKHTPPQASLTRTQRLGNVKNAFFVNRRYSKKLIDKTVLLIDDVTTTGATINACTVALLNAGVKEVNVITLAKTIQP